MPYEKHYSHPQRDECILCSFQTDHEGNKLPSDLDCDASLCPKQLLHAQDQSID